MWNLSMPARKSVNERTEDLMQANREIQRYAYKFRTIFAHRWSTSWFSPSEEDQR